MLAWQVDFSVAGCWGGTVVNCNLDPPILTVLLYTFPLAGHLMLMSIWLCNILHSYLISYPFQLPVRSCRGHAALNDWLFHGVLSGAEVHVTTVEA